MSVSTIQTENEWHGMQSPGVVPIEAALLPSPAVADVVSQWAEVVDYLQFPGRLTIPNAPFAIPEQSFAAVFTERGASFENAPADSWPKVIVSFDTHEPLGEHKVRDFFTNLPNRQIKDIIVRPSNYTVDAEVLYTRFMFCLYKAGRCSLTASRGELFGFSFDPPLETDLRQLLYRAKVYRKLKYIERVFNVGFPLPNNISPDEVRLINIVFRGITEGEFAIRSSSITFRMSPSEIDLRKPPFDQIGEFSRSVGEEVMIFGQRLPTGLVTVMLNKAELASPTVVNEVRKGLTAPIDVRFEVLDNQIVHRFEAYAGRPQRERTELLAQFKYELAQDEPQELVDLIDEPLQGNVSSREASQIGVGWTQYNDLPDRYCPQEPEHDVTAGKWRVPIYLVYANGEGGPVGEVVIDEKTGVIVSHTPVDELRINGRALAEQILHA